MGCTSVQLRTRNEILQRSPRRDRLVTAVRKQPVIVSPLGWCHHFTHSTPIHAQVSRKPELRTCASPSLRIQVLQVSCAPTQLIKLVLPILPRRALAPHQPAAPPDWHVDRHQHLCQTDRCCHCQGRPRRTRGQTRRSPQACRPLQPDPRASRQVAPSWTAPGLCVCLGRTLFRREEQAGDVQGGCIRSRLTAVPSLFPPRRLSHALGGRHPPAPPLSAHL